LSARRPKTNAFQRYLFRFDYLVEADDVGMVEQFHDAHFAVDLLQSVFVEFALQDDFHCHLFLGFFGGGEVEN